MTYKMLAGAAFAALMTLAAPASGAGVPNNIGFQAAAARTSVAPHWLNGGTPTAAATELLAMLDRAPLDGFAAGPALASQARNLINAASSGDRNAAAVADQLLSSAWTGYVQALQRTPAGMTVADSWAAPRRQSPTEILQRAALAPSLLQHIRDVSAVNPIYSELRDAAWTQALQSGGTIDQRALDNLARVRAMPFQDRYVMVDTGSAKLWMVQDGRVVDSMKVIVGKASAQTPMVASTIYYATLNPYWNVPGDLAQKLIAPRVIDQGVKYLKAHNYEVLSGMDADATVVDPSTIDWKAVKAGTTQVRMRQLPGPANSMGQVKYSFPNSGDIYLHDTPRKELFEAADRDLSNGCIRLEDAQRLGRWLIGHNPVTESSAPEQHMALPRPVPIYVTYLTAQADGGQLSFSEDVYGKDRSAGGVTIASLR